MLGVAYKRDIDDIRESPALDVMKLLLEKGGRVSYSDPHVPELAVEGLSMSSRPLSPAEIKRYDCIVITTAHSTFDYPAIVAAGVPIVDARNALKNHPAPHVEEDLAPRSNAMSRMMITGGAGFIGSHIAERLADLGHEVRVLEQLLDREARERRRLRGSRGGHRGGRPGPRAVKDAVRGVDVVFHEAALASVPRSVDDPVTSDEVNVHGTLNVLVASRDAGVRRVVYASSSSIYGNSRICRSART